MEESDACAICLDSFTFPKILPCGHTFCFQCSAEISSEQRTIRCPLCRAKHNIPKRGLRQFITNYFVPVSKLEVQCVNCKMAAVSDYCSVCHSHLCMTCFKTHLHLKGNIESYDIEDDENDSENLNLSFRILFLQNVPTKYICKVESQFVVEIPQEHENRHIIHSLCPSRSGGIYLVASGVPFVLKFDKDGRVLERIRTPYQCFDILEVEDGNILGTFTVNHLILKYAYGGWSNFSLCLEYYPMGLAKLSNGNVVACGPGELVVLGGKTIGHIHIYSPCGKHIKRISGILEKENICAVPYNIAVCKDKQTIAIVDKGTNSVLVLHENGDLLKIYKGGIEHMHLQLPILGLDNFMNFHPHGICCSSSGSFIVSSSDGSCLHILSHSGEFKGLALTNCEDGFGTIVDVTQDRNGTIWCSDSLNGIVKTLKIVRFKNDFNSNCCRN